MELKERFKNWKSTSAFVIFVGAYIFALIGDKSVGIVDIAASTALLSSLFMMLRSDFTVGMLEKLIDNISIGKK